MMPPVPSVALECRACGVSFERKAYERVRGNVYCSRKCYYEGGASRGPRARPKTFKRTLSDESKRRHDSDHLNSGAYCSLECYRSRTADPEIVRARRLAWTQEWRKRNPDRLKAYRREASLRAAYGIGVEDYERMYAEQEGCCAICATYLSSLVVDHCHTTGRVRGLLCTHCNVALGGFRDRADLLHAAASYLVDHGGEGAKPVALTDISVEMNLQKQTRKVF